MELYVVALDRSNSRFGDTSVSVAITAKSKMRDTVSRPYTRSDRSNTDVFCCARRDTSSTAIVFSPLTSTFCAGVSPCAGIFTGSVMCR